MSTHPIVDTHCHLDFDVFDKDRKQVIQRAFENHVSTIIIPATQRHHWNTIQTICADENNLYACYGLHPYWSDTHNKSDLQDLETWSSHPECIGIGECGLDYRTGQADKKKQNKLFEAQLNIATNNKLPIVIHSINATEDIINLIKKYPECTGKMHSYSGSYQQAQQLIDLGFYISFGGTITYENATKHRFTASRIPLNYLLVESNAPDQPDYIHKNERNEPAYIIGILENLNQLRNETLFEITQQTTLNAKDLFKL